MTGQSTPEKLAERVAQKTPQAFAKKVRGLSDRAIAWIFITPTMLLLLAINIFPLIWTIQLSFTNYRANRANAAVKNIGIDNLVEVSMNAFEFTLEVAAQGSGDFHVMAMNG